jgi:saccharopine dehydrogenase-like NADP-dependent oxidoreductase
LVKHLTPRLQFQENERDVAVLHILTWGLKDGKKLKVTYDLLDYRDLQTGLFGMNRTVGFTASIAAQMILSGKIVKAGVLSPVQDVPAQAFVEELKARGIHIRRQIDLTSSDV